jgi:hypothetical protein
MQQCLPTVTSSFAPHASRWPQRRQATTSPWETGASRPATKDSISPTIQTQRYSPSFGEYDFHS